MSSEFSIKVNQINKHFKSEKGELFSVLKDINFNLKKGETLALIGQNGSGKTTLLKIIAEMLKPTVGSINLFGNVAALIDIDGFFDRELTGRENVIHFLKMNRWTRKAILTVIDEIMEFSGLGNFFERKMKTYSKGMQARLILSTVINLKADLFLIDEVFFAGDMGFIQQLEKRKNELCIQGVSFIIATHNPIEVRSFATECIWIESSEIRLKGKPDDVLLAYQKFMLQKLSQSKKNKFITQLNSPKIDEKESPLVTSILVEQQAKDSFSYLNGFRLRIEYEKTNKELRIFPGLHILDANHRLLCISTAINTSDTLLHSNQTKQIFTFNFPKETLVQGSYFIELFFLRAPFDDLPHLEEVFRFPQLIPLTIHADSQLIFGEDDPQFPLNLKASWTFK